MTPRGNSKSNPLETEKSETEFGASRLQSKDFVSKCSVLEIRRISAEDMVEPWKYWRKGWRSRPNALRWKKNGAISNFLATRGLRPSMKGSMINAPGVAKGASSLSELQLLASSHVTLAKKSSPPGFRPLQPAEPSFSQLVRFRPNREHAPRAHSLNLETPTRFGLGSSSENGAASFRAPPCIQREFLERCIENLTPRGILRARYKRRRVALPSFIPPSPSPLFPLDSSFWPIHRRLLALQYATQPPPPKTNTNETQTISFPATTPHSDRSLARVSTPAICATFAIHSLRRHYALPLTDGLDTRYSIAALTSALLPVAPRFPRTLPLPLPSTRPPAHSFVAPSLPSLVHRRDAHGRLLALAQVAQPPPPPSMSTKVSLTVAAATTPRFLHQPPRHAMPSELKFSSLSLDPPLHRRRSLHVIGAPAPTWHPRDVLAPAVLASALLRTLSPIALASVPSSAYGHPRRPVPPAAQDIPPQPRVRSVPLADRARPARRSNPPPRRPAPAAEITAAYARVCRKLPLGHRPSAPRPPATAGILPLGVPAASSARQFVCGLPPAPPRASSLRSSSAAPVSPDVKPTSLRRVLGCNACCTSLAELSELGAQAE
ncbi:hypothetical protein FB451DRAFT_1485563 [Mycena latifolia]|nr:hypothetical protein FB451DRAFT_1485563 [Mycena latifolia]